VNEKAVNTAVAVFKGMHEDEAIGDGGGMDNGGDLAFLHRLVGSEQAFHQFREIVGSRADIVNELPLVGNSLPYVVLGDPVICVLKPGIDEASKILLFCGMLLPGMLAFALGTAGGLLFAKLMNIIWSKNPINPLIGSAGVSAFPMTARVSNKLGLESGPHNFLLMHALGANVAGQIGSVVAAGVILAIFGY
jgi:Na+-transporting oxaloacetate decarboxylase beta subunit